MSCNQNNRISPHDKKQSEILTTQSEFYVKNGNLDSAKILIQQALKLNPKNYVAYNNRAYLTYKENRSSTEVLKDYKKALEIRPDYDVTIYSLANYYFAKKDYKMTINMAKNFLDLVDEQDLDSNKIQQIYAIKGESEKYLLQFVTAIKDLQKSIQLNPNDQFSHKELADCYFYAESNNIPLAIKEYTKAIKIDSNYYQAYLGRANCFESKSNTRPSSEKATSVVK